MSHHTPAPAVLDDDKLAKVKQLEGELGDDSVVVAYTNALQPAELRAEQLARLKQMEEALGVLLVAWKRPTSGLGSVWSAVP
jgi:hypothetical protein